MIELYTWSTPNGRKASIMLEELGAEYRVHPINILQDEQFAPEFLAISPNNRIPAIVDPGAGEGGQDLKLMESGAILIYLAEKYGQLMPASGEARLRVLEWLMWQMGGVGPMFGQANHFLQFNPGKAPYAEERYYLETRRLYGVLNTRLQGREWVCDDYSIADIAIWPWTARHDWQRIDLADFSEVQRWYRQMAKRPAVQRGYSVPSPESIPEV